MPQPTITISATVVASLETAWEVWTQPEHITKWNFASDDWCCPSATNDMRVGGTYKARMEAKDGSFGFDFEAVYDDIVPQKSMTYTMPDGRRIKTDFAANGTGTTITTVFDAESNNPVEMQQAGWQAILNNFKRYAETLK